MNQQLIYLASPYSHPDPSVKQSRVIAVARVAGELINQGQLVFSPIAHGETIVLNNPGFGDDWQRWQFVSRGMIAKCDAFWIAMIEGWETSIGVAQEIQIANRYCKTISLINTTTFDLQAYKRS